MLAVAATLSSCALTATPSENFDRVFTASYEANLNAKYSSESWRIAYDSMPLMSPERVVERNRIVQELMWICDRDFDRYIDLSYDSRTGFNIATDVLVMGASSAASLASGGATTALAAVAAGATGFRGIINTNLYGEATRDAIIAKMRAIREEAKATVYEHMSSPADAWPLESALLDVSWYSQQGNARQAVRDITATSTTEQLNSALRVRESQLSLGAAQKIR